MYDSSLVTEYLDDTRGPAILDLQPTEPRLAGDEFARSVAEGLSREPRRLECRFLYDARGSELFELICSTPEYYPTRTEAALLERHAAEIAEITGQVRLVELGSGSSTKTVHILDAYLGVTGSARYVPVDVSRSALEEASRLIGRTLPEVDVKPIHGTYDHAYGVAAELSPAMLIFLGSSIGNFDEDAERTFFDRVADALTPGDFFLLGVDLVKDVATVEAAYNDSAGYTEAFTRNMFSRMNRELGAEIDTADIEHVARYNGDFDRIETYAKFNRAQDIHVEQVGRTFAVSAGEHIRIEISRKFRLDRLVPELAARGLHARKVLTDERDWFSLLLLEKA